MTSLVAGGAGFVGSHLTEELVKRGRNVIVVDDLSNGRIDNLAAVSSKVRFKQHDITFGFDALEETHEVEEVYYLACFPRQMSFANPVRDCQVNLTGTVQCLELARKTGAKLLFTSNTGIVSNPPTLPVDEDFAPNPLTPYDTNKLGSEYMLKAYSKYYGIRTVTVRFASIYGPRQRVNEKLGWRPVIPEFATKLLKGEAPLIDGNGEQTRDFLYVKDAVAGVIQAVESNEPTANKGEVFILGTNIESSILETYSIISRLLNSHIKPKHGPAKLEEIKRMRYDSTKAKTTFDFAPRTKFEDGLRDTVEFLRKEYRERA